MKAAAALLCAFALVGACTATVYMKETFDGAWRSGQCSDSGSMWQLSGHQFAA